MKKTSFIYSLAATFITAALTTGSFTACSSEDIMVAEKQNATQAQIYTVNIPATFGDDAGTRAVSFDGITSNSTFSTSEQVYVYNKTKNAMLGGYLSPANLRSGDKVCNLTGTLTGTIEASDQLVLLYNQNGTFYTGDPSSNKYEYDNQNGVTPLDGATAEVVVSDYSGGVLTTTTTASFTNVQSMFRLKFTDGSNDISVKRLNIESKNSAIASFFRPLYAVGSQYTYGGGVTVSPASATSDYLYVALCINEALANGDELTFIVLSDNNKLYEGTKAAPSGGFMNGKYYYNTTPITLAQSVRIMPTFTGASAEPDEYFKYTINDDPTNITISGVSKGYRFWLNKPATVTLDNVYAEYNDENFIYGNGGNLTVNLIGTNTLKCNYSSCIAADRYKYNLKLTGNGTLTVSVYPYSSQSCGLDGMNYTGNLNDNATTGECDVSSQLALDPAKTTVIRSARSGNNSAGWTWTYTVTQK